MSTNYFDTYVKVMKLQKEPLTIQPVGGGYVVITELLLAHLSSPKGGMPRRTILALGEQWPLREGWRDRLMGKKISQAIVDKIRGWNDDERNAKSKGEVLRMRKTSKQNRKERRRMNRENARQNATSSMRGLVLARQYIVDAIIEAEAKYADKGIAEAIRADLACYDADMERVKANGIQN